MTVEIWRCEQPSRGMRALTEPRSYSVSGSSWWGKDWRRSMFALVPSRGPCVFPAPSRGERLICAGHKDPHSTVRRKAQTLGWGRRSEATRQAALWRRRARSHSSHQTRGGSRPGKFSGAGGRACGSTSPPTGVKQRRGGCPQLTPTFSCPKPGKYHGPLN